MELLCERLAEESAKKSADKRTEKGREWDKEVEREHFPELNIVTDKPMGKPVKTVQKPKNSDRPKKKSPAKKREKDKNLTTGEHLKPVKQEKRNHKTKLKLRPENSLPLNFLMQPLLTVSNTTLLTKG